MRTRWIKAEPADLLLTKLEDFDRVWCPSVYPAHVAIKAREVEEMGGLRIHLYA